MRQDLEMPADTSTPQSTRLLTNDLFRLLAHSSVVAGATVATDKLTNKHKDIAIA